MFQTGEYVFKETEVLIQWKGNEQNNKNLQSIRFIKESGGTRIEFQSKGSVSEITSTSANKAQEVEYIKSALLDNNISGYDFEENALRKTVRVENGKIQSHIKEVKVKGKLAGEGWYWIIEK